jgi:hypothetical protein
MKTRHKCIGFMNELNLFNKKLVENRFKFVKV